jgi:hypothetical protein
MNVSTFTKKTKHEIVAFLILIAFLLFYSRKPVLIAVALIPIAIAALLIMRTSILRRFARTPIRQVAFADLLEPIVEYRQSASGRSRPEVVGHRKREIPLVKRIDHCYVDFEEYIARKGNSSVMVCGRSGMGKSELMNVLLLSAKEPKIVFSFKPNDAYLRMPCKVIDVSSHIPDPFQNADAFSIAYAITFPANVRGITFSQVRAIVKSVTRESKNWNEFRNNLKRMGRKATDIQKEALALIEAQIEGLVVGEGSFSLDLTKDAVLDFSYLDESAKTFYAEIALRRIWSSLTSRLGLQEKRKTLIVIDEVHRLTQLYETEARTIVDTLMRQIRQFGALYTATQNYSDIPDALRNQFATQLTFTTTSERDLEGIRKIDSAYVWIVKELRPHQFIDLTFRVGNGGVIPIFRADRVELPARQAQYAAPSDIAGTQPQNPAMDYGALVRERLDCGNVVWVSRLASQIEENYHIDKNVAKLKVRDILLKLLSAGEVQAQKYDDAESGETLSLYFAKSEEEKVSGLHRYMVRQLLDRLGENRENVLSVAESGQSLADVETESAYYEIETGLKTRTSDLEERISKLSAIKPLVVLVPNSHIAKSERYASLTSSRVNVTTLAEFLNDANARP